MQWIWMQFEVIKYESIANILAASSLSSFSSRQQTKQNVRTAIITQFASSEEDLQPSSPVSSTRTTTLNKMPAAPSSKKANAGPGYYDLIKEAVLALKERMGSSRHAIDKYVAEKKGAGYAKARLNIALKKGVEAGKLVMVKGSYKLAADEKKSPKTPVAKKKVAGDKKKSVKKTDVKKADAKKTDAKKSAKPKTASKPKKATSAAKPKAASKPTKKAAPATKKVTKSTKKVSAKKPTTTKKKVVKKSAAKKVVAKKQE